MNRLIEHPNRNGSHGPPGNRPGPNRPPARPSGPSIDPVKVAWDSKWLILLGLIVGLGGGYAHFIRQPAMYRSASKVQIIESSAKNLPVQGLESVMPMRSLGDEALVMRSERNLKRAAELGDLASTPEFSGLQPEQIAGYIGGGALTIAPVSNGGSTSVFQVQFDSTNASTSQRVVQAVIDAYGIHLQDQYRNVGQETIDLIDSAREDVLAKLNTMEKEFADFKQSSALIYRDGVITSVYRDNADTFLQRKQALILRKAELTSTLGAVQTSIENKAPLEAVLIALWGSANSAVKTQQQISVKSDAKSTATALKQQNEIAAAGEKIQRLTAIRQLNAQSRTIREQKLVPLELERKQLATTVGTGHQAIKSLDDQIDVIKKSIQEMEQSEANFQRELEAAWNEAKAAKNKVVETAIENATEQHEKLPETINPAESLEHQVRLAVLATRQQLQAVERELKFVAESYTSEMSTAKTESQAEIKSAQFVREIDRQQQLYDRIMQRLDEVNLMSGGEGLKVYPLDTAKLGYQFAPSFSKSMLMGGFLGVMCGMGLGLLRDFSERSGNADEGWQDLRRGTFGRACFQI